MDLGKFASLKANLILIICLLCSIVGIFLIYFFAKSTSPSTIKLSDIDFDMIGRVVSSEGKIVSRNVHEAGHLFLVIEDEGKRIQVPIFASLMNKLNEAGLSAKDFAIGKRLSITGLVSEYREQIQIVPRKVEDIRIK
jgi:DNA/RNA endonuclease YhcR with UshA esterase domain